jgi:polysaccharide export outer membrane protein
MRFYLHSIHSPLSEATVKRFVRANCAALLVALGLLVPGCRHAESGAETSVPEAAAAETPIPEATRPVGVIAEPAAEIAARPAATPLASAAAELPVEPTAAATVSVETVSAETVATETEASAEAGPYLLRVGDQIEISVLDELEMSRNVRVIPDGTITYLLIGEVPAAGRTVGELRESITAALGTYFVDPRVSVILTEIAKAEAILAEQKEREKEYVSILGALRSPGKYEMTRNYHLLDLIAEAGGLLYTQQEFGARTIANLKSAYLSRNGERVDVDFDRLLRLGDMSQNVPLAPQDFVYIPDAETNNIYVLGEVTDPRPIPFSRDVSLVEAIATCGGFTEQAQRSGVIVVRPSTGTNFEIDLERLLLGQEELNLPLESGDIIFVPEQGLSEYSRYANYLSSFANLILSGYQVQEQVRYPRLKR